MIDFIQYVVSGLILGGTYALIAIAFIVIYRSTMVFNFAQGEMVMLGGFLCWWFITSTPLPAWLAIIAAIASSALLGMIIDRFAIRPLIGQPLFSIVMITVALILALRGLTIMVFSAKPQQFPPVLGETGFNLGPTVISTGIYALIAAVFLVLILWWLYNKTKVGLTMSAIAEDHQVSRALGIDVKQRMTIAWAISGAVSAIAALVWLNAGSITFATAEIGLRAIPCALLAGLESIPGALVGALIIGIGEALALAYIDPHTAGGMSTVFPFLVLLIIMMVRPEGIFGWKRIERL